MYSQTEMGVLNTGLHKCKYIRVEPPEPFSVICIHLSSSSLVLALLIPRNNPHSVSLPSLLLVLYARRMNVQNLATFGQYMRHPHALPRSLIDSIRVTNMHLVCGLQTPSQTRETRSITPTTLGPSRTTSTSVSSNGTAERP